MAEKILVADDERHIVEGLQMLLADDGFEVDTATDGKKAWELVSQGGYGGEDDGGRVAALQRLAELPDGPDEATVVEPGVEILEDDQRRLLQPAQRLERGVGVLGLGREGNPARVVEAVEPAHGRPADERLAVTTGDVTKQLLHPTLFRGDEVDQRVARTDERVQLAHEARPAR